MNYDRSIETEGAIPAMHDRIVDSDYSDLGTTGEDGSRKKRFALIAVVAVLALAAVVGFLIWRSSIAPAETEVQVPIVSVAVPGNTTVSGEITATGTLAARRPMPVGSVGEGGSVVDVMVDAGDWVRAGQVLAVIDRSVQSRQAEAQAAQVQVARADAELAQANLDRALKLVDRGFISTADVDRLTATRDSANARVRVAEATLGELRARNARLNIVAPAGGLVLERNVERGQVVGGGGSPLFVLARGGEMELNARIGEGDLARLSVGVPAEVTPVGSKQVFTGQVWQLSPTIDETSRQGVARIAMPYDKALRPGGFATARITSGSITAPILPESAIMSDAEGSFVYVVGTDNKVARKPVELGMVTAKGITIAGGLAGNEKVVLRAGGFLSPGDVVEPTTAELDG
ncbi:efflux RND transporter periplasmic adaptor subunit [Croceicoccus sp. Ery5]|uniref:efflux RND transporter periplasmic adaptor subunit n=1 Tax=Croceicoccus sp. Ery5 TaxID=1703340 RepID=UPI001E553250|nr:efflux RND transporter periplasmic adaptor subunit [Croceicoccus sp. Ery5]